MARSQTAAAPAKAKSHRPARTVTQKASSAGAEFNPAEHHQEIAVAAYFCWLERGDRPGSPEEDWMRAEAQVRGRCA